MANRTRNYWPIRFVRIFAFALLSLTWSCELSTTSFGAYAAARTASSASSVKTQLKVDNVNTEVPAQRPDSATASCDIFYLLVSTIDGKFSALDIHKDGSLAWSAEADSRPLFSSSLAHMELLRNGKKMRLIPSLDGALYQFDGEKVEAIPMSAETLLSTTYKLSDDSMIVGSKDLRNLGIDLNTGEIQFACGSEGCNTYEKEMKDSVMDQKVIVLTRTTQVVRSVDIKNGLEKWNFSVGQYQVSMSPGPDQSAKNIDDDSDEDDKGSYYQMPFFKTVSEECPPRSPSEDDGLENYLRLIVPEGRVVALNKNDVDSIDWEYKFDSPIAKAWLVRDGRIEALSLFDGRHIPTLGTFQPEDVENESLHQPLLYIGSHQKLLYIQPSPRMESVLRSFSNQRMGHVFDPNIKVSWRPYLNTASYRTPLLRGNKPGLSNIRDEERDKDKETSLTVWHEEYPFDNGYFLYPEFQDKRTLKRSGMLLLENMKEEPSLMETIPASLWMHWKEVAAISVLVSIVVHVFLTKFLHPDPQSLNSSSNLSAQTSENDKNSESNSNNVMFVANDSKPLLREDSNSSDDYVSRFATDFECLHCLGKGGFGVVFEAINKVDDMHYAVKRTMLPKSEGAKEKVLREVRALAKLEHVGIVRYFNAWVESPPPGWQEERDKEYKFSVDASQSTVQSFSPSPIVYVPRKKRERRSPQKKTVDLKPDIRGEAVLGTYSDSIVFGSEPDGASQGNGSREFSVHSNFSESSEDGSDSCMQKIGCDKNKLCSFQNDLSSSFSPSGNLDLSLDIPFSNYTNSASSIPSAQRQDLKQLEQTDDSIVFEQSKHSHLDITEDSIIFEHSKHELSAQTDESVVFEYSKHSEKSLSKTDRNLHSDDSIVFQHSNADSGTGTGTPDFSVDRKQEHAINITLSSGEDGAGKDKETKELSNVSQGAAKFFLYIQMQLYRKETLKDWLTNNTLNRGREMVLDIFDQIACAVDYVHKCGLMHRDLKPSNIFFSADGLVKVGDFGLVTALSVQQDQEEQDTESNSSTKHTAKVGTFLYMSPEQIARRPYNFKVDIFSLGLIFLELWIPFATQMERLVTLEDAKRQKFPANFTRELPNECELVKKMTSEDPSLRPSTQDILDHPLLKDLAPTRMSYIRRSRTISDKSSS